MAITTDKTTAVYEIDFNAERPISPAAGEFLVALGITTRDEQGKYVCCEGQDIAGAAAAANLFEGTLTPQQLTPEYVARLNDWLQSGLNGDEPSP